MLCSVEITNEFVSLNDNDYRAYRDKLKIYSRKYKIAVHSYVLMTPETEYGVS